MKVRGSKKNFQNTISVIKTIVDKKNRTREQRVRDWLLILKILLTVYVRPVVIVVVIGSIIGFIAGSMSLFIK